MPANIKTIAQTIEVDGVADVVMTEVVQDTSDGSYVREFRVMGPPSGVDLDGPVVFTLRVRANLPAPLRVTIAEREV